MRAALREQRAATTCERLTHDEASGQAADCWALLLEFQQYQTLLEVSESIALYRDLSALFHDLAQWQAIRNNLHRQAETWRKAVANRTTWDDVSASSALSSAAHTAYHLGAIRQILAAMGVSAS